MSEEGRGGRPPTEEELRAAYEEQIKKLRVDDVVVQTIVSLLNLGGRKAGMVPGTEDERDPEQLRIAIEAVRGLLPLVESALGEEVGTVRSALSQLQMTYARLAGGGPSPASPAPEAAQQPGSDQADAGPAQRSGRLWVPGQGGGPPPRPPRP
jgi:hypothetical protein